MAKLSKLSLLLAFILGGWSFSSCEAPESGDDNTSTVVKGLVIYTSSPVIIADGKEEAILTVKSDGIDVTSSAIIYKNKARMNGNRFITENPGNYEFFASYKGKVSRTIVVKAANPALYVELPQDVQVNKFSDFQRKVLVAEGTYTTCPNCPYMIRAMELFSEKGANANKAVIVAAHTGDEFSNPASEAAVRTMRMTYFPCCAFNLNPDIAIGNDYPETNAEKINAIVGMELMEDARVGIASATAISKDSTLVAVRAAVKVGKDGSYRINAWLIEDGVLGYQSSNWPEFSDGKYTVLIDHMHILRDASCVSPIQGELLGEKDACVEGDVIEFYHEFDVTESNVANTANCKVAVLVTATSGTSSVYYVNNIVECKVGESVPFAYN